MPLPEGYRPREGDVVLIRAEVRFDVADGEDEVHLTIGDLQTRIAAKCIHSICSHRWEKGDQVITPVGFDAAVLGVDGDAVWVKIQPGQDFGGSLMQHQTFQSIQLKPATAKEKK